MGRLMSKTQHFDMVILSGWQNTHTSVLLNIYTTIMYYLRFPYNIWGGSLARHIAPFVTLQPQPQNYENICSSKALPYQKVNKKIYAYLRDIWSEVRRHFTH